MNPKELIKNKGLGYWICAGAAVVALIMAIVVFATWDNVLPNRVTDGYVIGIVFLIAFVVQAVVTFFPIRFAAIRHNFRRYPSAHSGGDCRLLQQGGLSGR